MIKSFTGSKRLSLSFTSQKCSVSGNELQALDSKVIYKVLFSPILRAYSKLWLLFSNNAIFNIIFLKVFC